MIKVYSLLTLSEKKIRAFLPEAIVASPIQRGDIYGDLSKGVRVIVMIDGKFQQSLSVACGEIMDALRCGVAVFGSSSMGALRAAEMHSYGMVGCGEIFEHIKSSREFRDDYLGQIFAEESGVRAIRPLSVPFVDFYFNLKILLIQKVVNKRAFRILTKAYEELYYTDRNWLTLRSLLKSRYGEKSKLIAVANKAMNEMGSQKERDALQMLHHVRDYLREVGDANRILHASKVNGNRFQIRKTA